MKGGAGRGYPFGGANTEQGDMRGEDMINLQSFYQITYQNTYTTTSANNKNHWEQLYGLINQANVIIQGVTGAVEAGIITADVGDPYIGEALFLRALAHHELLVHFSRPYRDNPTTNLGIPYSTIAYTTPESVEEGLTLDRGNVADAYQKVILDLDQAEELLPAAHSATDLTISRATKGATIGLKTRVKLFMQDYAGAIAEGTKLGTNANSGSFTSPINSYALTADVTVPFLNYKNNTESIFSISQSVNSNAGVNGAITGMYGPSSLNGRDLIGMSPNLYNASFWLADDKRKTELTYKQATGSRPFVYAYKYRNYGNNDDWNPILRYSEVLLNVAEAYAYTGNNVQALRLLNAVRDRSVGASHSFGTKMPADLKLAIYNERRIEFFAEGKRWGDIHRLAGTEYNTAGIPAKVLPAQLSSSVYDGKTILEPSQAAVPYSNFRFVWPLPATEVDANPTLRAQQNPGY